MTATITTPDDPAAVRYAVVRSRGCYGDGETVYAARVSSTLDLAESYAAARTRSYRREMARYGGSSGGYRVVVVHENATRANLRWLGMDLDLEPDA